MSYHCLRSSAPFSGWPYSYSAEFGFEKALEDCFEDMKDMGATGVEILANTHDALTNRPFCLQRVCKQAYHAKKTAQKIQKIPEIFRFRGLSGAAGQIRTADLILTKDTGASGTLSQFVII